MVNSDIKQRAKQSGVFLYQVAQRMGISEATMTRKLRNELTPEEKDKVFDIINSINISKAN